MYKRSDKVAFMATAEDNANFARMTCFTELSTSKNAKEYSRQYVDEISERSDVVGYAPSMSYKFDREDDNAVQDIIVDITDNEKIGLGAHVKILVVDLVAESGTEGSFDAVCREFSVIPNSEGDSTDAYTYSGTFKACGEKIKGIATTTDSWKTCKFTPAE